MGKYDALRTFLEGSEQTELGMTFAEIERVLGFELPPSRMHRAWWSNNPQNNVMTRAWLEAGFQTEQVDIEEERLVFRRIQTADSSSDSPNGRVPESKPRRRHPAFGALKDVTWIAPDVDLTEPADPEWADIIEDPDWHP